MNIIYTGDLFHLFSLEEQERVAVAVVRLLAPQPGSLIIGRQSGGEDSGEYSRSGDTSGRKHFRHNPQSWKELWDRVGEKTGAAWSVQADLRPEFTFSAPESGSAEVQRLMGAKGLRYTIKRL